MNEAANTLSPEQVEMQVRFGIVKHLPERSFESVKPMEKILMTSKFYK